MATSMKTKHQVWSGTECQSMTDIKQENDWTVEGFCPGKSDKSTDEMGQKYQDLKSETDACETRLDMDSVNPDSQEKTQGKPSTAVKPKGNAPKIFECDKCGWQCGRKDQFLIHTYIHSGKRPHDCSVCGKSFSRTDGLVAHMRIHTGEKPFKCDYCEKAFRTSGHRWEHMLTHEAIKPYTCDICEHGFSHPNDLTKHKRMHTGERPYPCLKCPMLFKRFDTLKKHVRRKHDCNGPVTCPNCAKTYKFRSGLTNHKCQCANYKASRKM